MDQAGWHKARTLVIPANIRFFICHPTARNSTLQNTFGRRSGKSGSRILSLEALLPWRIPSWKPWPTLESNSERVAALVGFDWIISGKNRTQDYRPLCPTGETSPCGISYGEEETHTTSSAARPPMQAGMGYLLRSSPSSFCAIKTPRPADVLRQNKRG